MVGCEEQVTDKEDIFVVEKSMKLLISCSLFLAFFFTAKITYAVDTETGRYQIFMTQIQEKEGSITNLPILLDTVSGRVWYMTSGLYWQPMRVVEKLQKTIEQEFEFTYVPNPIKTSEH